MSDTHAQTVAYVREGMLAQAAPPTREAGAVKWVRENLFPTWANAIMTIVSLYVIWFILSHLVPWFVSPTWSAGSLTQCREILQGLGMSADHACWGVIRDR